MASRQPKLLPREVVLTKIERVTETLIALGNALEDAGQRKTLGIIVQCIKDMTAIHETIEQL